MCKAQNASRDTAFASSKSLPSTFQGLFGPFIFFYFGLKVKKDAGDNGLKHATTLSWTFRKIKPAVVDSNGCAN
jgi:hypothetical protein